MSVVSKLTAIADAIRAKTGGTTEMTPVSYTHLTLPTN